jgi:hypothetical protein
MHPLVQRDIDLITFAREIAVDHWDIEDVLDRYQLRYDDFRLLFEFPRFTQLLATEEETWASAKNTHERVRLKSAALIEGYLEAAHKSLHSANETLVAKTALAKLIGSFAGLGEEALRAQKGGGGSGFSITINLGDRTLSVGVRGALQLDDDAPTLESDLPPLLEDEQVYAINADLE